MKPSDDRQSSKPGSPGTRDLGFVHVFFMPASKPAPDAETPLLLHGTGGDERELLPLGRALSPGAALLGVRGHVLENGASRFFCRLAGGGFDVYGLKERTNELARFIDAAAKQYGFSKRHLIAVGYSNEAIIAASLIFLHPHYLTAALLFRVQVPFWPDLIQNFSELPVFIAAGIRDPFVPRDHTATYGHPGERRSGRFHVSALRRSRPRKPRYSCREGVAIGESEETNGCFEA